MLTDYDRNHIDPGHCAILYDSIFGIAGQPLLSCILGSRKTNKILSLLVNSFVRLRHLKDRRNQERTTSLQLKLRTLANMSIGVPIKVLHEAEGHIVTCETNTGEVYRGKLIEAEDNMNCQMANITVTHRDGRVAQLEQVYIRGSKIRFLILPDMLKNAPMLKSMKNKNQGSGAGRGKAAILKAQVAARGRGRGGGMGRGNIFQKRR
ncbi:hypothetical protein J4Q44_G00239840 [Coregonus suidteri]|uniref:Small nuclear ribonucleoprotein Sm D3 n=2 Tax=Coregonus TaxID=27772 RepID=A0AAN8LA97_9TELE